MDEKFCQSCAMPMNNEVLGTNEDGSKNDDYCMFCYKDGKFTGDMAMEDMINFCVPKMVENNKDIDEKQARLMMEEIFPKLKRWSE
ncbi:zinc ribbon domain-containing protein [Methanobrevibacter sp. DSM 116169]|uniref:zinc ribbon domain-containing protein n=1 Tax=Methanobrevibacter sp. DSM 116169 TaxID=3242727 RepID=UPI0038FC1CDD